MIKKILIGLLFASNILASAQTKEPTMQETINFINKVMESDKFSSKYNKSGLKKSKPSFKLIEKCKIIVEQSQDWGSDLSGDYTFILDLSKQEFISTFPFTIKDRNGIASIHVIEMREDKEISNKYKTDAYFGVTINGEYKQKIIKATANLSRICHEKF